MWGQGCDIFEGGNLRGKSNLRVIYCILISEPFIVFIEFYLITVIYKYVSSKICPVILNSRKLSLYNYKA